MEEHSTFDFVYVHTDIPAGATISEWRRQRIAARERRRELRLRRAVAWLIRY
jgi:hypothetical protein